MRFLIVLLLCPLSALAGPWPRGQGEAFLSYHLSAYQSAGQQVWPDYGGVYAEYGVNGAYTLILELGATRSALNKGFASVRLPPWELSWGGLAAVELGGGLRAGVASALTTLTLGRGGDTVWGTGWATLDLAGVWGLSGTQDSLEAELTLGVSPVSRVKLLLQGRTGYHARDRGLAEVAPSVIYELYSGHHLEFGASAGTAGARLRLGMWHQF